MLHLAAVQIPRRGVGARRCRFGGTSDDGVPVGNLALALANSKLRRHVVVQRGPSDRRPWRPSWIGRARRARASMSDAISSAERELEDGLHVVALARRGVVSTGDVRYHGKTWSASMRRHVAFVEQDDLVIKQLSVRETLQYQSLLRLPARTPEEKRACARKISRRKPPEGALAVLRRVLAGPGGLAQRRTRNRARWVVHSLSARTRTAAVRPGARPQPVSHTPTTSG